MAIATRPLTDHAEHRASLQGLPTPQSLSETKDTGIFGVLHVPALSILGGSRALPTCSSVLGSLKHMTSSQHKFLK